MLNLSNWLGGTNSTARERTLLKQRRASAAHRRIMDKPESIAFRPPGATTNLDPQTVRVESDTSASMAESPAGAAPNRKVVVFGWRDHPSLADTNMGEGYRFVWPSDSKDSYVIRDIILTIGEIQGLAEATS